MTPNEYCQKSALKSGSSFYYSFIFLPPEQRTAITAVYAFCREVDDIADSTTEKSIATKKLHWWKEEIDRLFEGKPTHLVTQALLPYVEPMGWKKSTFLDVIAGMLLDVDYQGYESLDDLKIYCYHAAGAVGILSSYIFGGRTAAHEEYAKLLGQALQLINIIRDVGEDAMMGRVYLPQDMLAKYSLTPLDVLQKKDSPMLRALLLEISKLARDSYAKAFELLPDKKNHMSALIMANVYLALLDEIEDTNFDVMHAKISLTPLRKFWIAFKTKRKMKAYQ